jgi:beta-lactam-binding protein with PASTA domain
VTPRVERDPTDPLIGRLLDGRYEIGPRIARGGMASVYEAMDTRLDRVVAVKVMHPGMGDDDEFAARFVREARAAARLSHPNVVGVFDQGDEDGTVYLAMEYVPGHTLRDVIRKESPMPPSKALALLEPVLSALAEAHRAGLVHRDVKPENVLIADDGRVKVADFGLAKAVSADTQHTATGGVLIGTVSYLAPELVVDGKADTRADVYAAGVVLYELLTGRKPHEGESPIQVAYKHVHEDIPPPSRLVPEIPPYVDALVARATARDGSLRPADARVLLHQVHQVRTSLSQGLEDDPELLADLALPARVATDTAPIGVSHDDDAGADRSDTAEVVEDGATSRLDREAVLGAAPPSRAPATRPAPPHGGVPATTGAPRRRRRGAILLVLALVAALAVAGGAYWFGWARWTTMPSVVNTVQAAAVQELEAAGFEVEVTEAFDEDVSAGNVVSTDPGPGERVLEGGEVTVVVSKGKERYDVPDVRGQTADEAGTTLEATNLGVGRVIGRWHEKVPEGLVIRTNPERGTPQKRDTDIDLVVSKGPKPIKVRDFTGRDADAAEEWFSSRGVDVDVTEEFHDEVAEGRVISQSPRKGTTFKGETVELVVSKGPELIAIPRVRGQRVSTATETLEALGFKVVTQNSAVYLGLGIVGAVDPGEGDLAPKGSTVTLSLV